MRRVVLPAACLIALFAGCTDLRERVPATSQERGAAERIVAQGAALADLAALPRAEDLVDATVLSGAAALLGRAPVPAGEANVLELGACAASGPGATTFTGCELAGHTIDGSVSRMGSTLRAELTDVFVDPDGREGAATFDGAFALGRGRVLHGTLDVYAVWSTHEGADAALDAEITFDRVLLTDDGCAISGSLHVSGRLAAAAPVARTLAFGPACGDVTVAP